jgi:hypothetical protein
MERQYDYRPRWTTIIFGALFFGACAIVLAIEASSNQRGMILNSMIVFTPTGATIFYWVLTATSVGFVIISGFLLFWRATRRQRIAVTDICLIIPRSRFSTDELSVPFGDIVEVSVFAVARQRSLTIVHKGGRFTLAASLLPKNQDFDQIYRLLTLAVEACRSPEH